MKHKSLFQTLFCSREFPIAGQKAASQDPQFIIRSLSQQVWGEDTSTESS